MWGTDMTFELVFPWVEWTVITMAGGRSVHAKIDTGSPLTLVGIHNARALGISTAFTSKQPCMRYSGVSGKSDGYAFKVSCSSLPVGDAELPCSFVYIPFEYIVDKKEKKVKYKYITPQKYLIGTDILNGYDVSVKFKKASASNNVESVSLKLTEHGFNLSTATRKEQTFYQLAPKVDEIGEITSGSEVLIECVF
jgi:hypothetical protein